MAVPDYQTLMLPLLKALAGGEARRLVPDITDEVAAGFALTDDDLGQMLPSGMQKTFINRMHWAGTYMTKAGLLTRPERGKLQITARGQELLASDPARIDIGVLSQYPEFVAFRTKPSKPALPDAGDEENPEESLYSAYGSWRATIEADLLGMLQSDAFHWSQFEHLVVDLLHAMGYGRGEEDRKRVTKMTGDHGIDGIIDEDRLGLDAVYIQAKNYGPSTIVGQARPPEVCRQPARNITPPKASSSPPPPSRRRRSTMSSGSAKRIVLIDGPRLAALMYDYGIGVRLKRSLHVKTVDDIYFEGEG